MIPIGKTAENDSGNSTQDQTYITVFLDRMTTTSDFMKANMVESASFDDEGINIDCRLPKGSRPESMASIEALAYYIQGEQYENAGRYKEAADSYMIAAELGHATAQNNLGFLYANGLGVPKDVEEAYKWYYLAAEQNECCALTNLGDFYKNGTVVEMDKAKAIEYYIRAAELGYDMAQVKLGVAYINGEGTEPDHEKALRYLLQAGEKENTDAMRILGICYHQGYGTEKDDREALKWYRKAAEKGDSDSQCNLAIMLYLGQATEPNKEEAREWFVKSAQQGNENAIKHIKILFGEVDLTNYVDLGLPSGTKWADRNVGAGTFHEPGTMQNVTDVDGLPTYEQATELIEQCDFYKGSYGETVIWKVQGPNGNHIFFVESENEVTPVPAAICCCAGANQGFRPFLMITTHNITVGMTIIEKMPARRVKNPS